MTRDGVGYRASRRFALGSHAAERAMGITALRSGPSSSLDARLASRPVGLMKWSFDDFLVEEQLPPSVLNVATPVSDDNNAALAPGGLLVRVTSEGVPDPVIATLLQRQCRRGTSCQFLTPVDFVSSASRHVWVTPADCDTARRLAHPQRLRTPAGTVQLAPALHVPCTTTHYPLHWLPDLRYTVVLRDVTDATLAKLRCGLRGLATEGFLNYTHLARHGVGALRAFEDARAVLRRDYVPLLRHHAAGLVEGAPHVQREVALLQDLLTQSDATASEWAGLVRGMDAAVGMDGAVMARAQTGLYAPHHTLLVDLVHRIADLAGRGDSALLVREAVSRLVLQERLHTLAEVHFNAVASLRWRRHGARVVVGDDVLVSDAAELRGDVFEAAADHVNGALTSQSHVEWVALNEDELVAQLHPRVRRVHTEAEAACHDVSQVVLPFYGRGVEELGLDENSAVVPWRRLAQELELEGMSQLRLAPRASYRRLVVRPRDVAVYVRDAQRGWDWAEDAAGAALGARLVHDTDGILRLRPPWAMTAVPGPARRGIDRDVARHWFCKPARRGGVLCVLQFTLPRGSPVTSALREVFQLATLSPAAIFRLMTQT